MPDAICQFEGANWLLFGPNVPPLIYYSHIPNIVIALGLALFILFKNRKSLANQVLFYTILAFEIWAFFALAFWASNRGDIIMFSWLMDILVEPLVYIGCLYLLYILIDKKDISFTKKVILALLYLPIPIFLPTKWMLSSFDPSTCLAVEGPLALYYTYLVEGIVTAWVIGFCLDRFIKLKGAERREVAYLGIGTFLLLFAFAWGNIIGSFSENWELGDYGMFGMPIFLGFLVYSIVKFKLFNMKILGTSALVLTLWAATASLLSIEDIVTIHRVIAATLVVVVIVGLSLINSVRREVKLREQVQTANEGQANLLHIINHQIKGYMTKARLVFDDLLTDASYNISDSAKPMIEQGYQSVTEGVEFVRDFLNASNIEKGTFTYNMVPVDFDKIVAEQGEKQKDQAVAKALEYKVEVMPGNYGVTGDLVQLDQAVRNLIDNSIKYTPKGFVHVKLENKDNKVMFTVHDSGVGLSDEVKPKLFTKGGRDKDSQKININSTGFGLAFVKGVAEAHKGRTWAESPGQGKGSTFYFELPLAV